LIPTTEKRFVLSKENGNSKNENRAKPVPDDETEIEFIDADEATSNRTASDIGSGENSAALEQLEKVKSEYLYMRAEFENYKKQQIKERSDYMKYGSERLILELLDVLDNFDRALKLELSGDKPETVESFRKGMELTASEFKSVLKKFGVEQLESKGLPFDPNFHEALGSEETDAVKPGYITNVFRSGYKLHDRMIRPGQVIVAREKSKPQSEETN
jgi:molecular chaperone GrpE